MTRLLLLMATLFATANCLAAGYSVTQITNTNYTNEYPKLNTKGDMVWAAGVNPADPGWTLFLYNADTKTSSAISDANVFYDSHLINAKGDVSWLGYDGHDYEIYLYSAATQTTRQLTNNDNDDTNPQLSDNGNVSWFELTPNQVPTQVLMNYDAATMVTTPLVFTGATRQGLKIMNADGDIAWAADIDGNQDILLYKAASKTINNISNGVSYISSNEALLDSGDIVWEAYDSLTYTYSLMRYNSADGSTTTIATDIDGFMVGNEGDIVWTTVSSGTYAINTYDPMTEASKVIATNSGYQFNLAGISARGDVAWRTINGTNWLAQVYNAETGNTVDLTVTQAYGAYELHIADNGDVAWSLWDGTDYEVSTYQTASGTFNQLSNNNADDGVITMNANGTLAWDRWDPAGGQLFLAVKSNNELTLDVSKVKLDRRDSEIKLLAEFSGATIPSPADIIAIHVDGATLVSAPLAKFRQNNAGVYKYQSKDTLVIIDFNRGMLKASSESIVTKAFKVNDGMEIRVDFGSASAVANYTIKPRK